MTTPIWFLDIDGVINVFPKVKHRGGYRRLDLSVEMGSGLRTELPVHVRAEVIAFINRVHREGLAEVRWLTTWGSLAARVFAPAVGLDAMPVAAEPPDEDSRDRHVWSSTWWKLRVIHEQVGTGDRFVFTDDDLSRSSRQTLRDLPAHALLVTPFETSGLVNAHLRSVEEFFTQR